MPVSYLDTVDNAKEMSDWRTSVGVFFPNPLCSAYNQPSTRRICLELVIPMPLANADRSPLAAADQRQLDEQGYLVLSDFMSPDLLKRLRHGVTARFVEEGDNAGNEFKQEPGCRRLANLVDKGDAFREIIAMPRVLSCVRAVLGPAIKLSSLNAREVPAHCDVVQPVHADMGAIADVQGFWVCNTVWLLDPFTSENGALRLIPGSHRWGKSPEEVLADRIGTHPGQILVTGEAGAVIVMNAHLWHGGTANRAAQSRTAVHAFYARRDKPQQHIKKGCCVPKYRRNCRRSCASSWPWTIRSTTS